MDCTVNKSGDSLRENGQKVLRIVYGDGTLGVHGGDFSYIFSFGIGGPESLVIFGKEWLYRAPRPTFWRALTDNDRGSRFHLKSGTWLSADMFINCIEKRVYVDGGEIPLPIAPENNKYTGEETAKQIRVVFTYETLTVPSTQVEVSYEVNTEGRILVDVHYYGKSGLPELPVFGMRFVMPTKAAFYRYEGLSGETYPDRMAGGIPGIYEVEGLPVTPYLVPQDCNVHMDTKWLIVYRNSTLNNTEKRVAANRQAVCGEMTDTVCKEPADADCFGLRFSSTDKNFAFSCIPYTAEELENATHREELPPARRTVVSILGAVRGVGGINSWGADVEPAFHIDATKDIRYSFVIEGVRS